MQHAIDLYATPAEFEHWLAVMGERLHLHFALTTYFRTFRVATLAWGTVPRYFRKQTTAGMGVLNPETGNKGFYKHLRYSAGISALCRQGLELLPVAGDSLVFITEPGRPSNPC